MTFEVMNYRNVDIELIYLKISTDRGKVWGPVVVEDIGRVEEV